MFESNCCEKVYKVGMYLRISKEDENTQQSESIKNQREFVTKFILENGWDLYDEYIDDGYTGTNFNRPDFQRMIKDIEAGLVNLVIVKDYSRFGRNYSRAGIYLDEFFPRYNVRFIAINDGIDTFKKNNNNNELSGFKGVMNDMYSADISKKVRTAFNSKRQAGLFIGAFAPYGYIKDPNNKNKLIIDPEASIVVKRIFNMRVNGIGNEEIMRILNNEGVLCPTKYKEKNGSNYKNANITHRVWRAETIKDMLSNPTYIGNMTQGKCERISYKVRKYKKIPKQNWIIVENTHEPIIDKKTFETVQELMKHKSYGVTEYKTDHLLGGLLVCGDCGSPITFRRENRKTGKEFITLCSKYSRFHECTRHAVLLKNIENLLIEDLRTISIKVIKNKKKFIEEIRKPNFKMNNNQHKEPINQKKARVKEIVKLIKTLYEDWKKENISKEDFDSMYEEYNKEKEQLNKEIASLQNQVKELEQQKDNKDFYYILEQIVDFKVIPKQILVQLIEKIELFQDKKIKIHYKFKMP